MEIYDQISSNPLFTPYQKSAWESTFLLEQTGFISHEKAEFIRMEHLTVAWDPNRSSIVDLLNPNQPRPSVMLSNQEIKVISGSFMKKIIKSGIHQTYTGNLPKDVLERPNMAPLLCAFPDIGELGSNTVIVYGKAGDMSYWMNDINNNHTIGVATDFFGLPTQLIETKTKVYSFGLYPLRLCSQLLAACYEIIAREGHTGYIGVVWMIEELLESSGLDITKLAKDFVLGNPEPLLSALRTAHPLSPALLTFISEEADDTDISICRLTVIKALDK